MGALETIKFPDILEYTANQVIRDCPNVSRVEFGANFKKFGSANYEYGLFYDSKGNGSNVTIVFHGTTPPDNFYLGSRHNVNKVTAIYVPNGCKTAYTSKTYFEEFASKIEELPEE